MGESEAGTPSPETSRSGKVDISLVQVVRAIEKYGPPRMHAEGIRKRLLKDFKAKDFSLTGEAVTTYRGLSEQSELTIALPSTATPEPLEVIFGVDTNDMRYPRKTFWAEVENPNREGTIVRARVLQWGLVGHDRDVFISKGVKEKLGFNRWGDTIRILNIYPDTASTN